MIGTLLVGIAGSAAGSPATIFSTFRRSVIFVESDGYLYNGEIEQITGTGFLVSKEGEIVTNNHVVFADKDNYKKVIVKVHFGDRRSPPREAVIVARDDKNDLAVLKASLPAELAPIPVGVSQDSKVGDSICVLGFPLTFDVHVVQGVISGRDSENRWTTDSALNPGNSGGPVFNNVGQAIGIVTGGVVSADIGASQVVVEGIKFFVPSDVFRNGLAKASAVSIPISSKMPNLAPVPDVLKQAFSINAIKDDHPVVFAPHQAEFTREFRPAAGFKFRAADVTTYSANKLSDVKVNILDDGSRATVTFKLTSGPLVDQWRGWLDGTLLTEQVKKK